MRADISIFLFIGIVIVDRFSHLVQIVTQRRFACFLLRPLDVGDRDAGENADDRDDDDQLDERKAALLLPDSHHSL